jgi:hypothetical protein
MALTFKTLPQQMIFVDPVTLALTDAGNLLPNKDYDVYFILQNDSPVAAVNVTVSITHSAFGIGLPGGNSLITPPVVVFPVVPPKAFGINGEATGKFTFHTPAGGHGCLAAKIDSNGVCLNQNSSIMGVPEGTSTTGFLVFGNTSSNVTLTLAERIEAAGGAITNVPPGPSWSPRMIAPAGHGPAGPTVSPLMLTGLIATDFYTVGLQVTIPAGAIDTHIFHITGTDTNTGAYLGEVEIRLKPEGANLEPSRPFIFGGYQSADVILTDPLTGIEVPLGGAPGAAWDTLLRANTNYGFSARVHNDSNTPAVNTVVRFWKYSGGLASVGTLLDIQTVTIPANSSVIVQSAHPFISAALNQHACAVVSIYNVLARTCNADAVTFQQVPNPGNDGDIGCSAWRNTDSMWARLGLPWRFNLDLGLPNPIWWGPGPVEIKIIAQHVPLEWKKNDKLIETKAILNAAAVQPKKAMFLLPAVRETFKRVDVDLKLKTNDGKPIEFSKDKSAFAIVMDKNKITGFEIEGTLPKVVKKGDILLINVIANYPKTDKAPARNIEFLKVLYVTDKGK